MLTSILIATILVGAVAFAGLLLLFRRPVSHASLKPIISIAAGTLLASAFLDLLPEAVEVYEGEVHTLFAVALVSLLIFFLFERILHWHHCLCEENHIPHAQEKSHLVYINLAGDAVHNIVDGMLIAAAFMIDAGTGVAVTIAVILHEIPQEISDFGILLYAGLAKAKALLFNLAVAASAVMGALLFYNFHDRVANALPVMAAFAAGNFIYLAAADLIPELHHERNPRKILFHSILVLVGVGLIVAIGLVFPHAA